MTNRELDIEWMELIKQALDAGISKKEIREFLNQQSEEMKAKYEVI
ncbi:anti-repressor SinI family protein [Rossellomorea arthrocnemi]|nr:anti-repressor SinI family protein [Rossellomorea arthrocnemi]